jgi:hypothetical protein
MPIFFITPEYRLLLLIHFIPINHYIIQCLNIFWRKRNRRLIKKSGPSSRLKSLRKDNIDLFIWNAPLPRRKFAIVKVIP